MSSLARMAMALTFPVWCVIATDAQTSRFVPAAGTARHTVSLRELKISSKAKDKFEHGLQRLAKHDPEGSLAQFAAAIAAAPDFYEAYYHRGVAEMQLGRHEDALRSFQAAIDLSDGHCARAEFGYALELSRMGKAAEAERVVRHGLQAEPNIPDGHVVLGFVLLKLNRLEEAEKSAQEALLLGQPSSAKGHLVLADAEGARGNFMEQARELDAYLHLYPDDRNRKLLQAARDAAKELAARRRGGH
jgi:tetratricopeptide (TPR) repeat protein